MLPAVRFVTHAPSEASCLFLCFALPWYFSLPIAFVVKTIAFLFAWSLYFEKIAPKCSKPTPPGEPVTANAARSFVFKNRFYWGQDKYYLKTSVDRILSVVTLYSASASPSPVYVCVIEYILPPFSR